MSTLTANFKSPTFLAKILELAINSIATGLFMADTSGLVTWRSKWAVIFGTLIGFIMISILVIITTIMNSPMHRNAMLLTALCAAFLFFTTGGLIFEIWSNNSTATGYLIGSGIFAFLSGFIYVGDCLITFKYG